MTKKDYIALASAINLSRVQVNVLATAKQAAANENVLGHVAYNVAEILADDNPNFDRERFLAACGCV